MRWSMRWMALMSLTVFLLGGCAMGQPSYDIPSDRNNLYVAPFRNDSNEAGLENTITNLTTQQFLGSGQMDIVSRDNADAMLGGRVTNYSRDALIYNEEDVVQQYRVRITVKIQLIDPQSGDPLTGVSSVTRQTTYSDVIQPVETEDDAQRRVIRQLARDVVNRTLQNWPYSS